MIIIIGLLPLESRRRETRENVIAPVDDRIALSPRAKFLPWKSCTQRAGRETSSAIHFLRRLLRFHTPTTGSLPSRGSRLVSGSSWPPKSKTVSLFPAKLSDPEFTSNRRSNFKFRSKTKKSSRFIDLFNGGNSLSKWGAWVKRYVKTKMIITRRNNTERT